MISSKIFLLAESIIRDANTNNISIINIIESVSSPAFPMIFPKMCILLILEREKNDPEKVNCTFRMVSNDDEVFSESLILDFQDKQHTRSIITFAGVPLLDPGLFRVGAFINGELLDLYEIALVQVAQ